MSVLLPTIEAEGIRESLLGYLTTTFALADTDARTALERFLGDPADGIFKGPYVRARLPFRPADAGWERSLEWRDEFTPYGHQAAAFARLSSANLGPEKTRPLPTIVTTGTGSGKTEAFLYPILDHVLRAKRAGQGGIKALILYPMNALANDQARRLTDLIMNKPGLGGVRAALYTGQDAPERASVTAAGLITSRAAIRAEAPDILLTNYKMLDQLLLRSDDQSLWKQSASSLQFLVLDEFHTYDGAQGTDVAMLLRRLGLALERYRHEGGVDLAAHTSSSDAAGSSVSKRPLGNITPVATSATLGDKGDPRAMIAFAHTVFGDEFDESSVVTETRLSLEEWLGDAPERAAAAGFVPRRIDNALVDEVVVRVAQGKAGLLSERGAEAITAGVIAALYEQLPEGFDPGTLSPEQLLDLAKAHPLTLEIAGVAASAIGLDDLADTLLPSGLVGDETYETRAVARRVFIVAVIAALSHVRSQSGREALSIDLHLWVRSLTRLDRYAESNVGYRWSDDGPAAALAGAEEADRGPALPAIYCRHCGRSGWGVQLAPTGTDLDRDDVDIRRNHLSKEARFRALIHAPHEERRSAELVANGEKPVDGLAWFAVRDRRVTGTPPDVGDAEREAGRVLPVLMLAGDDADENSRNDDCPSCGRHDGIRFMGSAIATMLSVAVTTLFGDGTLDAGEKKALIFTDSVQDAAHRAAFVQSRSHVFTLRNAIRAAVGEHPTSLDELVERLLQDAGDDADARYRLLAPDVVDHENFREFWTEPQQRTVKRAVMKRVRARLLFDLGMEFGLQSRVGRTLELTGSVAAEVDAGTPNKLETIGRAVLSGHERAEMLDENAPAVLPPEAVVRWVRGVLERMRDRGAIEHDWFRKYIEEDGRRYRVWGGRPRGVGMPAFPEGRDAPGYPRVGGPAATGKDSKRSHLDAATSTQSWFAVWARDVLGVTAATGARLSRALFAELDRAGVVSSVSIAAGAATAYQLSPSSIQVYPVLIDDLESGRHLLACDICQNPVPGTAQVVDQLVDGPCLSARCPGQLRRSAGSSNYYRTLYDEGDMRRVVAREHTSMLDDKTRLAFEDGFKASSSAPDAPNVLVATPTLEMGIDIGDLSTVMLAGLPRTVASYLQRVGRAGRLTGNALALAFVTGRGEQLPKLGDPLSVIDGEVRPPATYLNAQEILQRQYFASLVDRLSPTLATSPQQARDVLKSTEARSFLGDVIVDAEANHADRLETFLGTFDGLSTWAVDSLHDWATPGDVTGSSRLAESARSAVARWNEQIDSLKYRKKAIEDSIPELKKAAEHPAATDDAETEYRSAVAGARAAGRLLKDLRTEHWVAALERFGLLPNYTLLDDSVRLDVALSWIDPDSLEYQNENISYERGAGIAISELAPGALFYAQGVEIKVDAVDLGSSGEAVRLWRFCPACGFGYDRGTLGAPLAACLRCGSKGIADLAQELPVVELEHVSAEVRRDEASISDRRDERVRERFTMQVAVDVDPQGVASEWFVDGEGFGVKYARDLTIRWLNLGRAAAFGQPKLIAGGERVATMFRVCEVCGKLDSHAGANTNREHRAWCPHRASKEEHATSLALSRTLTTQGVLLRLPPAITLGDSLAVPSLSAAIQRGLREVIGGDPDHLRLVETIEPVLSDGTENIPALLIHDAVPGGTGYLAELADKNRMHELLRTAWEIVRDCPCRGEGRASCHRCLLPYAPSGAIDRVSRRSAELSLAKLLLVEDGTPGEWPIVEGAAPPPPPIPLEPFFRSVFIERAKALGAGIKEIPGDWGNKVEVSFASSRRTWVLRPQVKLGHTTPDFMLEQFGGGAGSIAIYTDGLAFHASPLHNRIADDADKRRGVRDMGHHVIGVTWDDLKRASAETAEPEASWFSLDFASKFTEMYGLPLTALDHITANPMTQIMAWMQNPVQAAKHWEMLADALPMLTRLPEGQLVDIGDDSVATATARTLLDGPLAPTNEPNTWQIRRGHLAMTSRSLGQGRTDIALVLDDRPTAVSSTGFADDWRLWLRLSNLLGPRSVGSPLFIGAASELSARMSGPIGPVDVSTSQPIAVEWDVLLEDATEAERDLIRVLADVSGVPVPEMGLELGDGIPVSFVWDGKRVLSTYNLNDDDRRHLVDAGWTVVEPEASAITTAFGL